MNEVIIIDHKEKRILKRDIFEVADELMKIKRIFLASTISMDDYLFLKNEIRVKSFYNKTNNMNLELDNIKEDYLMAYDKTNDLIKIADFSDKNKMGSYILNRRHNFLYLKTSPKFYEEDYAAHYGKDLRIFTTSTFQDIITNYDSDVKVLKKASNF